MYFNDWLSRRRIYSGDRVAVVDDTDGRHYTYAQLDARASTVAGLLQHTYDISPGDRVACLSTNRLEYIDLYFACGKVGAVIVPLNSRLPCGGILELLNDCKPRLLVYEAAFGEVAEAAEQSGAVPQVLPIDLSPLRGHADSLAATSETDAPLRLHQADENETAMILYTSGTTGRAKGAMISWRQIHWNVLNTTIGLALTENDVAFLNMPLHHTGGWHVLFTPLMLLGARVVLQKRFDAERCNERVGPEGVTILFGVPTTLRMMRDAKNFAAADFSSVRFAIFGGEPCPLELIQAYQQRGVAMRQGYGLTEAGPNCFSLPAKDAIAKPGSIGFPNFHIGVRLVDEQGGDVGVDQVGELWMKGPHVFSGYWENPEETAKACRDGWLLTGDLMKRDADGYYYVVGRKKEMYVSGGENVYPAEVERVLQNHDAVALAAVVGMPDPKWGETGWACVQLHAGHALAEQELDVWCKTQLAKFQSPTKIIVMEELPVAHTGKVDKLALRKHLAQMDAAS